MSVTLYLGPDNIWFGNSTGFARKRDGYTFVGYVVVRTSVDLRGHCWRSRSWNAAVRLACSMIAGFGQAALSRSRHFFITNRWWTVIWPVITHLSSKWPFHQGAQQMNPFTAITAGGSSHPHISIFHAESALYWPGWKELPVFLRSETAHKMFYRHRYRTSFSSSWKCI